METIKNILKKSTNEKATILNNLLCLIFPSNQKENEAKLSSWVKLYNDQKTDNSLVAVLDSVLWNLYGLYHRSIIEFVGFGRFMINPIKVDKEIDSKLKYYYEEAKKKGLIN